MDLLTKEDIRDLLDIPKEICVSMYMPTHRTGREQQQDRVRFKNLMALAEEDLNLKGIRTPDIETLLQPVDQLLLDSNFWQHQSDGLAIFLTQDFVRYYRLPRRFNEFLRINHSFHIRPILPLLSQDGQFFILSLSKKEMQLHKATRFTNNQMDISGTPTNMEEALRFDDPEKHLVFHTRTDSPASGGERPAVYHGHGVVNEEKTNILRFFQQFDSHLNEILADNQIPLVLAGLDYLHAIYREANTYPHLVDEGINVNPKDLSDDQLRELAWDIVSPIFTERRRAARNRFLTYTGENNQMISGDLELVVQAAYYEAVDTLFVPVDVQKWGVFNPRNNNVVIHDQEQVGDTDLLDFAAMHTLKNSGSVWTLSAEDVPGEGLLAAILRYEYEPAGSIS